MQTLLQEVRYALRLLRRSPGFAATATATLAIAIGANAAIFSAVKGVLITPLPYAEPDRLVRLFEEAPTTPHFPMAPADFRDYRGEFQTFDGLAAYVRGDLQLGDASRPEQLRGMQVSAGFSSCSGTSGRSAANSGWTMRSTQSRSSTRFAARCARSIRSCRWRMSGRSRPSPAPPSLPAA